MDETTFHIIKLWTSKHYNKNRRYYYWYCQLTSSSFLLIKPHVLSRYIRLCATLWAKGRQAPLSIGFPRQEHWSGLSFPSPGDRPNSGTEPMSPALAGGFFTTEPPGKPSSSGFYWASTLCHALCWRLRTEWWAALRSWPTLLSPNRLDSGFRTDRVGQLASRSCPRDRCKCVLVRL